MSCCYPFCCSNFAYNGKTTVRPPPWSSTSEWVLQYIGQRRYRSKVTSTWPEGFDHGDLVYLIMTRYMNGLQLLFTALLLRPVLHGSSCRKCWCARRSEEAHNTVKEWEANRQVVSQVHGATVCVEADCKRQYRMQDGLRADLANHEPHGGFQCLGPHMSYNLPRRFPIDQTIEKHRTT
jgi:hypothetical protein